MTPEVLDAEEFCMFSLVTEGALMLFVLLK
jgi:hypothetical protein